MLKKVVIIILLTVVACGISASGYVFWRLTNQDKCVYYLGNALQSELFEEYLDTKFAPLRRNLDKNSNEVLDYAKQAMLYQFFLKKIRFEDVDCRFPENHRVHYKKFREEYSKIEKSYSLEDDGRDFPPEVFYFHHGLRFADKKILNYIKDKNFLDCGAYIGDSVLVLKDYTNKTIFCYEFSKPNLDEFPKVMRKNNIISGYQLRPVALGDKISKINVNMVGEIDSATKLTESAFGRNVIQMTTIDEEVKKYKLSVGFIKMDVEGYGLHVIKGAIETIKSQRPVLSLGIYHNRDELFKIKPLLEKHLKNYVYEFKLQGFDLFDFNEMILFAYPKEILQK